jgi:hypothetical protein
VRSLDHRLDAIFTAEQRQRKFDSGQKSALRTSAGLLANHRRLLSIREVS